VAPAPPCLTCVLRVRGARWGAKLLKIKGFYSDMTSRIDQKSDSHRHMRHTRTAQRFMHIIPLSPHTHCTQHTPPAFAHHTQHPSASHHVRRTQPHITLHICASREAVLLIRSTLPMSNVADSFSSKKAIFGPSEDKHPKG